MQSIIENSNNSSSFIFYILHQYISEENIDKIKKQLTHVHNFSIEFIDITELLLEHELYTINTVDSYTFNYYAPYIKFFIPYILRQYDRLLYIDTSIIFNLDIAAVFETYINDNAFTCWSDPNQPNLFSTDLMLINTKRFHDITPEHTFLEKINDNKKTRNLDKSAADLPPDQYFLNTFFADNIASFSRDSYNKEIINLKGNEQWTNIYASNIQYILKYASRTEFFNEILNSLLEKDRSITDRLQHLEEEKNAFKYNEIIMRNLRSSYSYRIGRLITWPLRIFLKCYRCYRHFGFRYTLNLIIKRGKSFILHKNRKILL
jgi:lipopolysaccharide biosynthesis glycosyltransferase